MKQCRPWIVRNVTETFWQTDTVLVPARGDGYPLQVLFFQNGRAYKVHTLMLRELVNLYPGSTYTLIFEGRGRIRYSHYLKIHIFQRHIIAGISVVTLVPLLIKF